MKMFDKCVVDAYVKSTKKKEFLYLIQVLSMSSPSFARTLSERDWLKNSAKIWELVKNSPIIAEYTRTLQSSGLFRR